MHRRGMALWQLWKPMSGLLVIQDHQYPAQHLQHLNSRVDRVDVEEQTVARDDFITYCISRAVDPYPW